MNNDRRKRLKKAVELIDQAYEIISQALGEEQDCIDNMPENLCDSERCEKMEDAAANLEDAMGDLDSAKDFIVEACN